jgi:hypothetical protein
MHLTVSSKKEAKRAHPVGEQVRLLESPML